MDNINKQTFWRLIKKEIAYFNKTWKGNTDSEKRENERAVLSMYYDSLKHATEYSLEIAFRNHRNSESHFPKIPQILKSIPKLSETYETKAYKMEPMPESVKAIHGANIQLDNEMKLKMANMIQTRFDTDFGECKRIAGLVI